VDATCKPGGELPESHASAVPN